MDAMIGRSRAMIVKCDSCYEPQFTHQKQVVLDSLEFQHILLLQQLEIFHSVFSRQNPFELIVALSSLGKAKGVLFIDDGESLGEYFCRAHVLEHCQLGL